MSRYQEATFRLADLVGVQSYHLDGLAWGKTKKAASVLILKQPLFVYG